jgi:hypothetical protein
MPSIYRYSCAEGVYLFESYKNNREYISYKYTRKLNKLQTARMVQIICNIIPNKTSNTYNVTLKRVNETIVVGESNTYYICVSARACARACVGARARTCASARVALLSIMSSAGAVLPASSLAPPYFSTLSHKRHDFREEKKSHWT